MRITFRQHGDLSRTRRYLVKVEKINALTISILEKYGKEGVEALKSATPVRSGTTADSWRYEIKNSGSVIAIEFHNDNITSGWFNVALMLDLGHGTGTGGWVEGLNYIDPAIQPLFEKMAEELWAEVTTT